MNADGFIDLQYVHNSLGLGNVTKFDEAISLLLEPYTILTFNYLGIDETVFTDQKYIKKYKSSVYPEIVLDFKTQVKEIIAARIACQLYRKDPSFGQKYNRWRVGNVDKGFQRNVEHDIQTWCDYYDQVLTDAENMMGTARIAYKKRRGLIDDYNRPY